MRREIADSAEVITVEDFADGNDLHPVQRAPVNLRPGAIPEQVPANVTCFTDNDPCKEHAPRDLSRPDDAANA